MSKLEQFRWVDFYFLLERMSGVQVMPSQPRQRQVSLLCAAGG